MFLKRNSTLALCVWLAVMQGMQGCKYRTASPDDLIIEHEISPQPPRVGPVTITLKLTNGLKAPITGAVVKLEGNMSHAGMAPVKVEAKETEPGRYSSTMELSMAGDWSVLVIVTRPDKSTYGRQLTIISVAPA